MNVNVKATKDWDRDEIIQPFLLIIDGFTKYIVLSIKCKTEN